MRPPTDESGWRQVLESPSPEGFGGVSPRSFGRSMQCSFSDQLKKITSDDSYDSLPRNAWSDRNGGPRLDSSCVGEKVIIGGKEVGILRYVGETHFGEGCFCGVELKEKVGRHNGTIEGRCYFKCAPGHGIFAPLSKVSLAEHFEVSSSVNRRSDPTCSSSKLSLHSSNRYSDCRDDRIRVNNLETLSVSSLSPHEVTTHKRKTSVDCLRGPSSNYVRKGCNYLYGKGAVASPDDVTESSLGILTPNQMPDLTTSSFQPSPSDEVLELPMDPSCEEATAGADNSVMDEEDLRIFEEDISMVIQEIHKCTSEVSSSSSESSSPSGQAATPEDRRQIFLSERIQPNLKCNEIKKGQQSNSPQQNYSVSPGSKSVSFNDQPLAINSIEEDDVEEPVTARECRQVPLASQVDAPAPFPENGGVKPKQRASHKGEHRKVDVVDLPPHGPLRHGASVTSSRLLHGGKVSKPEHSGDDGGSWHPSSMTLSSASLDPGYQGDAEFDVPSEVGSVSAGTPTQDPQESNIHEEVATGAPETSSAVATEADISLGDEEEVVEKDVEEGGEEEEDGESESSFIANRSARVIDGRLYHSHREMMLRGQEAQMRDQHASEMDSSGFYSDLDPREEENTRHDAPSLQPLKEDHQDPPHEFVSAQSGSAPSSDEKLKLVSRSVQVDVSLDLTQEEDKDKSCASILRADSCDQLLEASPAPSELTVKLCQDNTSSLDITINEENKEAAPPEKPRNYDKPWLSKPVVRKPEPPKKIVQPPPPPRPKKNVESKLKALLQAPAPEITAEERKARQVAKKNKWDEVMNKIAEGKEQEKERPKKKEVKSRLMEGVKAAQTLSPQAEKIRQERRERRERRERQQLAAAAARRSAVRKRR